MEYTIKGVKEDLYLVELEGQFAQVSLSQSSYALSHSPHVFLKWGYYEAVTEELPEEIRQAVGAILKDPDRCVMTFERPLEEDDMDLLAPEEAICGGLEAIWISEKNFSLFESFLPAGCQKWLRDDRYILLGLVENDCAYGAMLAKLEGSVLEIQWMQLADILHEVPAELVLLISLQAIARNAGTVTHVQYTASGDEAALERLDDIFSQCGFEGENSYMQTWRGAVKDITSSKLTEVLKEDTKDARIMTGEEVPEAYLKRFLMERQDTINPQLLAKDISCCFVEKKEITAALLVQRADENTLILSELTNHSNEEKVLMWLMRRAIKTAKDRYDEDTMVYFASSRGQVLNIGKLAGFERVSDLSVRNYRWDCN